jgi:hypothetical protein
LGADVGAALVPGLTGAGAIIRTAAKADKVVDAAKAADMASEGKKTYQTYTKTNPKTGKVYSGRTGGTGTPQENVAKRDRYHQKNKEGYDPAVRDKSSKSEAAIKGREQQIHEKYKAQGKSANKRNPVGPRNPKAEKYRKKAEKEFGKP